MKKYIIIFLAFIFQTNSYQAQVSFNELSNLLFTKPDSAIEVIDLQRSKILTKDSILRYESLKSKALLYAGQLGEAEKLIDSILMVVEDRDVRLETKYLKAIVYLYLGQFDESIGLNKQVFKEAQQINDIDLMSKVAANISANLIRIEEYDSALVYLKYSLEIDLLNNDSSYVAADYNLFGICYNNLGVNKEALSHYKTALRYKPDPVTQATIYLNISIVYTKIPEVDSAFYYGELAKNIFEEYNDEQNLVKIYNALATAYELNLEFDKAINYYEKALELAKKMEDKRLLSMAYNNLSSTFFALNKKEESLIHARLAFRIDKLTDNALFAINSSKNLAFAHSLFGNLDSVRYYMVLSDSIRDKHYETEYYDNLSSVKGELELSEKENTILKLNEEKVLDKLAISKQRNWMYLLLGLIVAAILAALLIIQRNKRKAQAEKDAAIIEEQDKGTRAVFAMQEEERKRISKDLHDGVGQQLAGLKINFQVISEKLKTQNPERFEELQQLKSIVSDTAVEIRNISHTMMPIALTRQGVIVALEEMLDKSFTLTPIKYNFEHFGIEERLSENVEISLYRIAQELVNNIIKHSNAKNVNVQLYKSANKAILIVEDDGKGISTSNTDGHGLLNMKSRVNTLNGDINLEPSPSSGTLATIRIPV